MEKLRSCDAVIEKVEADWEQVKNLCRGTVNKDATPGQPSHDFKIRLLIAEHSPIRTIRITWAWHQIKSWVATHFARHWLGWEKWIGTRRSDRTGIPRDALRQDELVLMRVQANAQALINVSRFRLCYTASPETRDHMSDVKARIDAVEPAVAFAMVPNCIYRGGCPEMNGCKFYEHFVERHPGIVYADLKTRYEVYNNEWRQTCGLTQST